MKKLIKALNDAGLNITSDMDEDQIRKIATAMGMEPLDYIERKVEIKKHTNQRDQTNTFVTTQPFVVGKKDGKVRTIQGAWIRVEIVDQMLEDLLIARDLLNKKG